VDNEVSQLPHEATFEYFDPQGRSFDFGATLDGIPAMGFASAPLGAGGVLVCGGGDWYGEVDGRMEPVATCAVIGTQGGSSPAAPLPGARNYLAMGTLADGTVLACGGLAEVLDQGDEVDATADAWVYDPGADRWDPVGDMDGPRAYHVVVPTADGRAVVVGGASSGGQPHRGDAGEPVACPEVFDPAAGEFTPAEYCGAAGSGMLPAVVPLPSAGAFAAGGIGRRGEAVEDYGIIGTTPPAIGDSE
jgi:hypothetical protein